MRFLTLSSIVIAAAAATTAYGQSLKAEVPFEFKVGTKTMPAGTYKVPRLKSESANVSYKTVGGGATAIRQAKTIAPDASQPPRMTFNCGPAGCALSEVRNGTNVAKFPGAPPSGTSEKIVIFKEG